MHPLVANGGELTVLRSLAAFSYGSWNVSWPASVPEDQHPVLPDERDFGYAAKLKDEPGRMGRRFVRANTTISAAEYKEDGSRVEFTGSSDVEQVLDAAAKRTDGDAFIEREFDRSGLGRLVPRLDFSEGDIVPVLIWGKLFSGPVETITDVVAAGQVVGWSVHVGGELVTDDLARRRSNRDLQASIAQERRERLKDLGAVDSKASSAVSAASAAQASADSVRTDFDALRARVERDARVVAESISRTVSQADFEEYDGKLQARLWGAQGEFNQISAEFQSKQEQINAQRLQFEAQQRTINDQQKKINQQQEQISENLQRTKALLVFMNINAGVKSINHKCVRLWQSNRQFYLGAQSGWNGYAMVDVNTSTGNIDKYFYYVADGYLWESNGLSSDGSPSYTGGSNKRSVAFTTPELFASVRSVAVTIYPF